MPLNKQVFRTRAISAVFFVIIMLAGLLWNVWSFLILFVIIHAGCWWEYVRLQEKIENVKVHPWVTAGFITTGMGIMLIFCGDTYSLGNYRLKDNFLLPLLLAGFILTSAGVMHRQTQTTVRGFARIAFGLFYLSLSWGMMLGLRQYGEGSIILNLGWLVPVLMIASIWINDTMAYIVGSFIGKTPLSAVSPKKTWEGTLGGIVLATIVVAIIARQGFGVSWLYSFLLPLLSAVAGTFGDLLESKLKRMAGVKDSGNMMPGHGGFLDRFDSMLLATPAVWLFLEFFG
jgi:phosphatidate cytidylyltransferase